MTDNSSENPLESWKEIAAYLQRDVRTAKRWEKSEGLPVHRHQHLARSSVYAFASELEAWRQARQPGEQAASKPFWRRPIPSLAFSLLLLLSLVLAGDAGPGVIKARAQSPAGSLTVKRLWADDGMWFLGAVSPDGRHLTFVDPNTFDLAVRELATGGKRRVTTDASPPSRSALYSIISPDSRQAAYTWTVGTTKELRLTPIDGGPPRILYRHPDLSGIAPHSWSADGKQILATLARRPDDSRQLVLVTVADGSIRVLKSPLARALKASLSPDGRHVAYDAPAGPDSRQRDIWLLATDGTSDAPLVKHPGFDASPMWAPDGRRVVFVSNRAGSNGLWAVEVSDGQPRGAPRLLKANFGAGHLLGFSQQGSLYYEERGGGADIYVAQLDPATGGAVGSAKQLIDTFEGRNSKPAWSPDGKSLAYVSNREPESQYAGSSLAIRSVETGDERVLPLAPQYRSGRQESSFVWSPDGRYLAYAGFDGQGRWGIFRIDARTGETAPIVQDQANLIYAPAWSSDSRAIYYVRQKRQEQEFSVVRHQIETGQETEVAKVGSEIRSLALSPDGRQLAFAGAFAVSFMPSAGGQRREVVVSNTEQGSIRPPRGAGLLWTPDGRHLLFVTGDRTGSKPSELYRLAVDADRPQKVGLTMRMEDLSISPDGQRIAFSGPGPRPHNEVWVLENLLAPLRAGR